MIQGIKVAHPSYQIKELCCAFDVPVSTYYDHVKEQPVSSEKQQMLEIIKRTAIETNHSYGKRRMNKQLKNQGFTIGVYKTRTLMKEAQIKAIRPKKKHYYPDSGTCDKTVPNLLDRQFNQEQANTHWITDITYIKNHQGWTYLAAFFDLGTKEVVGWSLSKTADAQLTISALKNAIRRKEVNTSQLLVHSDQGTQYTANMFAVYCDKLKITRSMSRRGNCWDNAVMERFFRNLKTERLNSLSFINHEAVIAEVESYISFYNYKRLNSAIGYTTPNQKYYELTKAA